MVERKDKIEEQPKKQPEQKIVVQEVVVDNSLINNKLNMILNNQEIIMKGLSQ